MKTFITTAFLLSISVVQAARKDIYYEERQSVLNKKDVSLSEIQEQIDKAGIIIAQQVRDLAKEAKESAQKDQTIAELQARIVELERNQQ